MTKPASPPPLHICMVCSGNICRSPYAEALLRHAITERGWHDRVVVSSGSTLGINDHPAHEITLEVAAERGLNLMTFRSSEIDETRLAEVSVFVALGREHLPWLRSRIESAPPHIWLITAPGVEEPDAEDRGILDPVSFEEADYRTALASIEDAFPALLEAIEALLEASSGR